MFRHYRILLAAASMVLVGSSFSGSVSAAEIVQKSPEAQASGRELVKAQINGSLFEVSKPWEHKGVASKSVEERDMMASQALYEHAKQLVEAHNLNPDNDFIRFAGVVFTNSTDTGSRTEAPPFKPRKYKAWGVAHGHILTYAPRK